MLTLDGSPIRLTALSAGVSFDVDGDGVREPIAWTRAGSTAAFLVLDLDGDGAITTGAELFGVPVGVRRHHRPAAGENSFTLLGAYDTPALGGNGDGVISAADAVFSRLRLWIDANHDGVSQPNELVPLAAAGVVSIELSYHTTGRRDGHGNFFRSRGVVHLTSGRRVPIWDVFLATGPGVGGTPEALEGTTPFDDEAASVATGLTQEVGLGDGADGDGLVAPGSAAPDPPPTPLQVVEDHHLDALGSVRAVTNAQGQVIARHDFLPFGEEVNPQFPPHDRKLFTAQERDFETALDYFHARQLRTDLGRFTAPDPLTNLSWTDGMLGATNAYGYVQSNPLGFIDPAGAQGQQPPAGRPDPCDATTTPACSSPMPVFRSGVTEFYSRDFDVSFWNFVTIKSLQPGPGPVQDLGKGGGGQQSQGPQQPENPNCGPLANNLQGTNMAGLDTAADIFIRVTGPLKAIGANMIIFATAAGTGAAGGLAIAAGCGDPTPAWALSCVAGITGGVPTLAGAGAIAATGVVMWKNVTLPAIKDWGCR